MEKSSGIMLVSSETENGKAMENKLLLKVLLIKGSFKATLNTEKGSSFLLRKEKTPSRIIIFSSRKKSALVNFFKA